MTNQTTKYLEILFPDELRRGDLEIIEPANFNRPGQAKLNLATIGRPNPQAPNSLPVLSRSGAKFGFIVEAEFLDAPYCQTYEIYLNGNGAGR